MAVADSRPGPPPSPSVRVKPTGSAAQTQRQSSVRPSTSMIWLKGMVTAWLCSSGLSLPRQAHRAWISPLATALPLRTFTSCTSALPAMSRTAAGAGSSCSGASAAISLSRTAARRTPRSASRRCWMPQSASAVITSVLHWVDTDATSA